MCVNGSWKFYVSLESSIKKGADSEALLLAEAAALLKRHAYPLAFHSFIALCLEQNRKEIGQRAASRMKLLRVSEAFL